MFKLRKSFGDLVLHSLCSLLFCFIAVYALENDSFPLRTISIQRETSAFFYWFLVVLCFLVSIFSFFFGVFESTSKERSTKE